MAAITMRNIVKKYGDGYPAVNDVSLDIADGEFMILVGPSGCGKSTLLRMIVGLEDISSGDMLIGDKKVNDKAPRDRNLSMVFQNYALYPHLTVFENIAFPLRLSGKLSDDEIRKRVTEAANTLELGEHLDRKPANLSGGQRQRVAMGRAIVREADAFLFDEPLSNLDAKLRGQMRTEILRLQRKLGVTTVYVTHDQTEAMTLGDRVAVLKKGVLQQVASPRELYDQPVNLFVAGFIGSPPMNFVPARVRGDQLELPFVTIPLREEWRSAVTDGTLYIAGIRPGAFEDAEFVDDDKRSRGVTFEVTVDMVEWLGNEQYAFVPFEATPEIKQQLAELANELDSEQLRTQLCVELDPLSRVRSGDKATLWLDAERLHLFDPHSGENLTRAGQGSGRHAAPTG
ncbi:sn-glycerol-3-phosphate ABC transporter ATP-binding protein UgpC [Mycolicibacterium rufum]|uniref:Trehalose import ATP-binding protein SugC n=1 Tax=Mycolicibacterium rufum TaxID=318424 RepID=A0A9X2YFZ2_9MYCO|nr:sn-glycerol-3-phosphate ABC transporter ATP-binding protein UgpC [Mycolicibacterium rufum]KGI67958.1 ABC transporter [Mycolicibacterium rufum]MCV7072508.1 sn-glycerol-3-phosphate ABC transporter ATP-binding protein UgpC [Mycolicibacterium rufum]ULP38950.1 sn-glycerol-3-phosphate ABC transporter ATP-binding protein UgpC [Mycolicibacterium rufum]